MSDVDLTVSTERLGWPRRRGWRILTGVLGEYQGRMRYEVEPDMPTATCHLQPSEGEPALCGYPWEGLIRVPGNPQWTDLHPDMRCDECEAKAGIEREDPSQQTYQYHYPDRPPRG
jgi:hypothetical protein